MGELILAMTVFVASHGISARPAIRGRVTALVGEAGFILAYSAMSVALTLWVAFAYAAAPYVELWPQPLWARWLPALIMPVVSVLWVAGFSTPNPFSLGPGGKGFNPDRPGILRLTRHPVLWGLALWAFVHIPVNGDAAALILFGPLLVLALAGPALMERKSRRRLGPQFTALARHTGATPRLVWREIGAARLAAAAALYAALIWLHPHVIGVWPLPLW